MDQEAEQFPGLIIKLEREPKKGVTNNKKNTSCPAQPTHQYFTMT